MDKFKVWVDTEGETAAMLKAAKREMEDKGAKMKSKPIAANKVLTAFASFLKEKNLILEYKHPKFIIKEK